MQYIASVGINRDVRYVIIDYVRTWIKSQTIQMFEACDRSIDINCMKK